MGSSLPPAVTAPGRGRGAYRLVLTSQPGARQPKALRRYLRVWAKRLMRRPGVHYRGVVPELRWYPARDPAGEHVLQAAVLAVLRLLAACGEPAGDLSPTPADQRAHAILTAAPPCSRAPVLAGAPA